MAFRPSLKSFLRDNYVENREIHPYDPTTTYIRVSSLGRLCPREEVLVSRQQLVRKYQYTAETLFAFDAGTEYHYALQNLILGGLCLYGHWQCLGCSTYYGVRGAAYSDENQLPRPNRCRVCDSPEFVYVEQHFRSRELPLAGHPDGFLKLPGRSDFGILEAKSISPAKLKDVRLVPYHEHQLQLQAYLYLTGLQWGLFLYWSKGSWGLNAFTEHYVERNETYIDEVKRIVGAVSEGYYSDVLPPRTCVTDTCARASGCVVKGPCFEEER